MILAALWLQLAVAGGPVVLRTPSGADTLRVRDEGGVAMVDASRFSLVGGILRALGDGRYRLSVAGAVIDLADDIPFARVQDTILVPLIAAPASTARSLLVPLQVVTELLPRFGRNLTWDAMRRELRLAQPTIFARGPGPGVVNASARPPAASRPARRPPPAASRSRERRLVVVDAGHGGVDPGSGGAVVNGRRIHEKDITLAVSRRVREALLARGLDVVMTRDADTLIALGDRGPIANRQQGDIFVSIHVNGPNPRWRNPSAVRGVETYFLAEAKTEDERRVEEMENEAVRFETNVSAASNDPLNFVIHDMAQNEHLRESSDLAERIQRAMVKIHPGPDRGVKQAGFTVLVHAFMPAVLVEIGFGSNPDEARWMASDAGQRAIAGAIGDAVASYLRDYERRVSSDP